MRYSNIDVAHCDYNARICKKGQARHLHELEMVSAECRAPSGFRNACFLHQHTMFMIIVAKKNKTEQKSHQRVLSLRKTSRGNKEGTIDSFKSDISMIV